MQMKSDSEFLIVIFCFPLISTYELISLAGWSGPTRDDGNSNCVAAVVEDSQLRQAPEPHKVC